jgi:glycosyltransferase involved in cell wall biosynthesis
LKQLVCLAASPWSAIPTRTQQLMARLRDLQVLFFEPPVLRSPHAPLPSGRRVRPNLMVYTLPAVPQIDPRHTLLYRRSQRKLAEFICSKLDRHRIAEPVLWFTSPHQAPLLDYLPASGLVYDCDRYWPDSLSPQEGALAAAADVIFAASSGLVDRLSPCNQNIALLPNGVNYAMYGRTDLELPADLAGLQGPVLGWAGTIHPDLDLSPVEYTAAAHPDWTFLLAGRSSSNPRLAALERLGNVHLLGHRPMLELPDYLSRFDVCLNLLRRDGVDSDVIPTRIYEYLSTGKPIVTMLYPDQVEEFPDVIYGAHTPSEFSRLCQRALEEDREWVDRRRRDYGQAAAWSNRCGQVIRILESIGLY